ncbi:MAG: phosphodiester glycosidase family protein [Clostridia bacterium]|nr:phosphodiester glycosidase family protein [Clostridia bacterium]
MKHSLLKKALSVVLTAVMLLTTVSLIAFADYGYVALEDTYLISDTERRIAPGVKENRIVTNNSTGMQQEMIYAVSVDPTAQVGLMAGYADYNGSTWKMQTVREQAAKASQATGRNIVAAVNADIFNMQTGEPAGVLVMNGNVYKAGLGRPYFGVTTDGRIVIGESLTSEVLATLKEAISGFYMIVKDGQRTGPGTNPDSNVAPKTCVGLKADGTVVIVTIDGRNFPVSNSLGDYDLATIMLGLGCVDVLNLDGGGSSTYLAKYEGKNYLELANNPSDAVERKVSSSLFVYSTARPSGEFDHAALEPNNRLYTPGSTVTFTATGVDSAGGSATLPAGVFALAADSAALGTITDDGVFTAGATEGRVTVNYVSGGEVVGTTFIEIATPDELYIPSDEYSLDYDETTDFGLVAKNAGREILLKAGDIVWSATADGADVTAGIGTFDGLTLTTRSEGSMEADVTAASAYDQSVTAATRVVIGAEPVMLYDFEYTTDQEEAAASEGRLQWIPSYDLPVYDNKNKPDGKTHTQKAAEWYEEGYPLYGWPNASLDVTAMHATVVDAADGEPVRFGDHALRMDVDFSSYNKTGNSNNYIRVTSPDYRFEGSPKKMSAWVYCPEGMANFALYLNLCNKDGSITYAPVSTMNGSVAENWVGWKYVEIDLTTPVTGSTNISPTSYPYGFYQGCGIFWVSFQPGIPNGTRSASTVYIDNIQLIYSSNTDDTKNPEITSITYDTLGAPEEFVNYETVLSDPTVTIRASFRDAEDKYMTGIDDTKVSMSIDGVDVTDKCYVNAGDGQIYFYDAELNNGTHSVSVTVYDNFGNKTTETRFFTVDADSPAAAELVAEQESPVLGLPYTLDVKAADPADIVGADIAVHTFAAFTYFYDDVHVEPAEGFALAGEPKYDATNAIISFKLERDGRTVPADGVIARIVYNVPSIVRSDSIDVSFRVDKGGLTFATTHGEKYLGSFGGTVSASCIAPLTLTSDTFLVGRGGYFYVTDLAGEPVEGAVLKNEDGTPVGEGATDAEGKYYTEAYKDAITAFKVRAEKDDLISFYYEGQSFTAGGDETGLPMDVTLNGAKNGGTMLNVSWFASPTAAAQNAVVKYAEKAAYEAEGEEAFTTFTGVSRLEELDSTSNLETNFALLFNKACVTGLKENTEYVYVVGDGEKMSELRTFKTGRNNADTSFFIIGDMQSEDSANINAILDALAGDGTDYRFGVQTGDAVDNGGQYRWWQNVGETFSNGYLGSLPILHVLGNHEYYGDFSGENSADYFGMETLADGSAPLAYSSVNGNVYTAVINYADASEENYVRALEWVREDAAASNALWKVLAIHQPAYYTNPGGSNDVVNRLIPAFVDENGFSFVFSGHDHSYMRTYPVTNGVRDDENGAVYYICGSTGEKSYQVIENPDFPYAMVRGSGAVDGEYEAVYLTATATDTAFTVDTHEVTVTGDGTYNDVIIDTYTMTRAVTCTESGKHDFAYADGALTCKVCGYTKPVDGYTGFAEDAATGGTRYFLNGVSQTGWLNYEEDCYYFDADGIAVTGNQTIDGISYRFDNEGRQIGATFVKGADGYTRAYRGGHYLVGWNEIEGKLYFFSSNAQQEGRMYTGTATIRIYTGQQITFKFASDGHLLEGAFVTEENGTCYFWGQDRLLGWQEIKGTTYYFDPATGYMATGMTTIDGTAYMFSDKGAFLHEGDHEFTFDHHQDASCVDEEQNVYKCTKCGETAVEVLGPATGHVDADGDDLCDVCGKYTKTNNNLWEIIMRFFIRIRNWFRTIFSRLSIR